MTTLLAQGRDGRTLDCDVIDMHGHLGRPRFTIPNIDPAALVARMDRIGVQSIVCSAMRASSADVDCGNAGVLEAMRTFPGRILGYAAVYPFDAETVRHSVEKWLAEGFVGLKFHNSNGFSYEDAAYEPAYAIADERSLPMLLHTWGDEQTLSEVRNVAGRHPQAALLAAHTCSEHEDRYVQLAKDCPNVYLDLALSKSPRGLVRRLVDAVGPERIVWGSDAYFLSEAHQIGKVLGADISQDDKHLLLAGNARRILDAAQK